MSTVSHSFVTSAPSTEDEFRAIAHEVICLNESGTEKEVLLQFADNLYTLCLYLEKLAKGEIR